MIFFTANAACLFGQPLDARHLLLELILVDHKVKANLAYAVSHGTTSYPHMAANIFSRLAISFSKVFSSISFISRLRQSSYIRRWSFV